MEVPEDQVAMEQSRDDTEAPAKAAPPGAAEMPLMDQPSHDDTGAHAGEAPAAAAGEPAVAADQMEVDQLSRQLSWALPELPSATSTCWTWGRSDMGQIGHGVEQNNAHPQPVEALEDRDVVHAAGSAYNSAFVTRDGELWTSGANDAGQLGVKGLEAALVPRRVGALESHSVHSVACGQGHMLAVIDSGALAAWGSNEFGQLGLGEEGHTAPNPRILRAIPGAHFARVAAGATHSLGLTSGGQVYSWGEGSFGALGHGDTDNRTRPTLVQVLWQEGPVCVAAGQYFSAAVSLAGRAWTWGRNKYGQLGSGGFANALLPQPVRSVERAVQVACGDQHTVVATAEGEVLAWGAHGHGQLGLGDLGAEALNGCLCSPKRLDALEGHLIRQVSAGVAHTFFVTSCAELWGCGSNEEGQLALGGATDVATPRPVPGLPEQQPLRFAVAAGEHSIAVLTQGTVANASPRHCAHGCTGPLRLPPDLLEFADAATQEAASRNQVQLLKQAAEDVFSSPAVMLQAFRAVVPAAAGGEPEHGAAAAPAAANGEALIANRGGDASSSHGLDLALVNALYTALLKVYSTELVTTLGNACKRLLDGLAAHLSRPRPHDASSGHTPDPLLAPRVIFALLQNPLNGDQSGIGRQLETQLCACAARLSHQQKRALGAWLGELLPELFAARIVRPLQRHISSLVTRQGSQEAREALLRALLLLQLLWRANEKRRRIALSEFHNAALSDAMDVQNEYIAWRQTREGAKRHRSSTELVSLCQLPWVLTPEAKSRIFRIEAAVEMNFQVQSWSINAMMQGVNPQLVQFLDIRVRRQSVLGDTLAQIESRRHELRKPLRVTFISGGVPEEGVDQGGVKKEFFQLLVREVFNEAYGMWTYNEETRTYWFARASMEADTEFCLVGQLMGLAIYNSVIIEAHFPTALYSKLLGKQPTFEDLKHAMPELGRGLQQLLDFDGDVEATFQRNFEVEYDFFGELRREELKPGGADIPVTSENRSKFVTLMTDYFLNRSVAASFSTFFAGFHEVCGGPALGLLREEELELLVCGQRHLDFDALQRAARYEGGYSAAHPTVAAFWDVVKALPLEQKRAFLAFATGSDRAPVGGLGKLAMVIQREGPDSDRLPSAHTCFNYLLLPEYASKEKLRSRLLTAIDNAQGFGLQ